MRSQSRTVESRWVTTIVVSSRQAGEGVDDALLGGRVEARGGLIEDEHGRSNVEGTGEAESLALAAGEPDAAFADDGLDPSGSSLTTSSSWARRIASATASSSISSPRQPSATFARSVSSTR